MASKVKIFLPYGPKRPAKASCAGNRTEPHYVERYTETGHPYLVKDGETDVYAIIQSHKEECDINLMLQRYAAGDTSIMRNDARYIDTSNIPTSIHEMFNYMNSQREKFDALPVAIKQKFDNSFEVWASTSGTADWIEKMGMNERPKVDLKKEEPEKKKEEHENGEPKQ